MKAIHHSEHEERCYKNITEKKRQWKEETKKKREIPQTHKNAAWLSVCVFARRRNETQNKNRKAIIKTNREKIKSKQKRREKRKLNSARRLAAPPFAYRSISSKKKMNLQKIQMKHTEKRAKAKNKINVRESLKTGSHSIDWLAAGIQSKPIYLNDYLFDCYTRNNVSVLLL